MPKGGKNKRKGDQPGKSCLPKKKCCISKDKCKRCPLLALQRGTLPEGYTVKKRKLVKVGPKKGRAPKLPDAA